MTPQRWTRMKEIFGAALEQPEGKRAAFLDSACGGDAVLRAEVEGLLAGNEGPSLQSPAANAFTAAARLAPGDMVAHYRIEGPLGEGGMGVVYKAKDTRLGRSVALKFASAQFSSRSEREARAVASLNHPNICTLHDVGPNYLVMELIEGETLAARLQRGKLSIEDAVRYGARIADALEAAHAQGIVHRDLKPGNVMLTKAGVKVLDFGLAKIEHEVAGSEQTHTMTAEGTILGTVQYMSPEQARGLKVDARSDLFSLGVMLYEMIAGRRPFDGDTPSHAMMCLLEKPPVPLVHYVPDAPEELQRILTKALEKDPQARYETASDLKLDLKRLNEKLDGQSSVAQPAHTASRIGPANALRRHWRVAAFSGAAVAVAAAALVLYLRRPPALTDRDTILLADFVNTTGDTLFDDALKQGLAGQLEQSPFLSILADERVRETLRSMVRSPDQRITNEIGREICQRAGVKALIEGSIVPLGSHYVLTLVAVNAASSEAIVRLQVEAESKERVLHALGGAATQLRRKLGESLASIQKYDAPPEQVTTSSLQALKAFSLARQKDFANDFREAILYARRAVELDPNFAMAHNALAVYYDYYGAPKLRDESARRAFELRGRTSELERLIISQLYYRHVTGELDRAIETAETAAETYPRSAIAWTRLGRAYAETGQYDKAVAPGREALRLLPSAMYNWNLAAAFVAINRLAEARDVCVQAAARQMDSSECHFVLYEVAFLNGESTEMKRQLEWASAQPDPTVALGWRERTTEFQGQLRREREFAQRLVEISLSGNSKDSAASSAAGIAADQAVVGQCRQAGDDSRRALELAHTANTLMSVTFASALCGDAGRTLATAGELAKLYPKDTRLNQAWLPSFRALGDIRRNHTTTAIPDLRAANQYGSFRGLQLRYCRGEVYLGLHMGAEAAARGQCGHQPVGLIHGQEDDSTSRPGGSSLAGLAGARQGPGRRDSGLVHPRGVVPPEGGSRRALRVDCTRKRPERRAVHCGGPRDSARREPRPGDPASNPPAPAAWLLGSQFVCGLL